MSRDVAEYNGIKYSLQPHGLRSKLWTAFAAFVVAFGGALAIAFPADAAAPKSTDPPGTCYIAVLVTPTPSPSPSASPETTPSPTPCPTTPAPVTTTVTVVSPSPSPVFTTITKQVTIYVDQTTTRTETVTITPSETAAPTSSNPIPSRTPDPPAAKLVLTGNDLKWWGVGTALVIGLLLLLLALIGFLRNRTRDTGRHHIDNSETRMIPVVPGGRVRTVRPDDHDLSDYGPDAEYDPALGGHAGESYETREMPAIEDDEPPTQ